MEQDRQEHLDELRRRLYRSDATEDDLRRYTAERDTLVEEQPAPDAPAADRRLPRRRVVVGLGVGLLLAAAGTVLAVQGGRRPAAAPRATPTAARLVVDVGDGQVLTVDPSTVSRPTTIATSILGTPVVGVQRDGRGNAVVAFEAPSGAPGGSRAMVVLVSNGPSPVAWRALLDRTNADGVATRIVLARGIAAERSGSAVPSTFVYAADPPTRIAVAAADDVHWTLLVAAVSGLGTSLR